MILYVKNFGTFSVSLVLAALLCVGCSVTGLRAQESLYKHTAIDIGRSTLSATPAAPRASGLSIVPTFDASITKSKNAAAIMATINAAITELTSNYSDPITVNVVFKNIKTGLGQSETSYTEVSFVDLLTAMKSHANTADDAIALSKIPTQTNNPVNGDPNISLTTANARTLGFSAAPAAGEPDSTVSLNVDLMNISPTDTDPKKYSMRETVLHELTEVLGSSSALQSGTTGPISPVDLFRYNAVGARSYTVDANATSYFSIDGVTTLAQFNQDKSGDFGDYYSVNGGQTPQIQDAFGTPGVSDVKLGTELIELDVIGYARASTATVGTPPSPPVITSAVKCEPNPAYVGGTCILSVSATDPNNSPITVAWDYGDGSKGSGTSDSHVYATAGTYTAKATILDGLGLSTTSSTVVNVNLTIIKATLAKKSFALNFKVPNGETGGASDGIDITLSDAGFGTAADGTEIKIIVAGDTIDTGTLSNNKAFGDFGGKFTLTTRSKTIRYQAKFLALQSTLARVGAVNPVTGQVTATLMIPITVIFNDGVYGDVYSFSYVGSSGKSGKGK